MRKFFLFVIFFLCSRILAFADVDLVVFSYDRPMQLYAFLESIDKNVQGIDQITVIFRASSKRFEKGYKILQEGFKNNRFIKQEHLHATRYFKPLLLEAAFDKTSDAKYIIFSVDDVIITRPIDVKEAADILEKTQAYGFFFRLGFNATYCYPFGREMKIPHGNCDEEKFFTWKFSHGEWEWKYPNNVEFTLYRKKDIVSFFHLFPFLSPNDLESKWAKHANLNQKGVCYYLSHTINVPLNLVSSTNNRHMNYQSTNELLELFFSGYKIDIEPYQNILNRSPTLDIAPSYCLR